MLKNYIEKKPQNNQTLSSEIFSGALQVNGLQEHKYMMPNYKQILLFLYLAS